MSAPKILFVDDDSRILSAIDRHLSDDFDLYTADGPSAGLKMVDEDGPFAVVISDMRMPGMTGVEMLKIIRQKSPDTVRVMLTGYADLNSTIEAVNEGNIFRFLSKPCSMETMAATVSDGIRQYQLVTAERELLECTLKGSVKVLFDVLGIVNPIAFGRASRVKRIAMALAASLGAGNLWEIEIAAMMSALGCITLSESTLRKIMNGQELDALERVAFDQHPAIGKSLLGNIPRLSDVARIVGYQEKCFDGTGAPAEGIRGTDIPLGARILKVCLDFDSHEARTKNKVEALDLLKEDAHKYDPDVLNAFEATFTQLFSASLMKLNVCQLRSGMVVSEDILNKSGGLLVGRGQEITRSMIGILSKMASNNNVKEPIYVFTTA